MHRTSHKNRCHSTCKHRIRNITNIKKKNRLKKSKTNKRRYYNKQYKGGNFGGNCPDPNNHSIYNSNMLNLFPYKP